MPDLELPDLSKEIEVGGRSFPLWVPIGGAAIAIGLVVISKLRGGGGGGGKEVPPGEQAGSNAGAFQSALGNVQNTLTERIAAYQTQTEEKFGTVTGLLGEQAGKITGLTQQQQVLQAAQQKQAGQITGFMGQLESQAAALQSGLAGTAAAANQFKADVNARVAAVEGRVLKIETEGAKIRKADRFSLAQMAWTLNRYIDETRMYVPGSTRLPGATVDAQGNVMYDTGASLLRWG